MKWNSKRNGFYAFCKTVLRNKAINAYRDLGRKQKHEISVRISGAYQ